MNKVILFLLTLILVIAAISVDSNGMENRIPDDKILIDFDVPSWVPNPLVGTHKWKKFFSDEKYSSPKKVESTWYYDSKTIIKATGKKLTFKGQALELEGATLVWTKVVRLEPNGTRYLFYALWPEKRIALFFGIFEREDGTKYVEDVSEMEDIQKMPPGMPKEVLENLFNAIFKPWWKVW